MTTDIGFGIWQKLSPEEFKQLQDYTSYATRSIKDVLKEFNESGILFKYKDSDETVGYEAFKQFMEIYLDMEVDSTLCKHLFLSFIKRDPAAECSSLNLELKESQHFDFIEKAKSVRHMVTSAFVLHVEDGGPGSSSSRSGSHMSIPNSLSSCPDGKKRTAKINTEKDFLEINKKSCNEITASLIDMDRKTSKNDAQENYNSCDVSRPGFVLGINTDDARVPLKNIVCYLSLLEAGRPEDKLEFMFHLYDTDGNGYLDSRELDCIIEQMMTVAKYLNWDTIELEPILRDMLSEIDFDSDGRVSLEEWKHGGLTTIRISAFAYRNLNFSGLPSQALYSRCIAQWKPECDFGRVAYHILSPTSIYPLVLDRPKVAGTTAHNYNKTDRKESSSTLNQQFNSFQISPKQGTRPLIVFINPKSGGRQGEKLYRKFQYLLNPRQVFNLSNGGPMEGLQMFPEIQNINVMCCGGDGTVGWLLEAMDKIDYAAPSLRPPVCILPLGTGNDLARSLRWGKGFENECLQKILDKVQSARPILMDRWQITISSDCNEKGDPLPSNIINNYFSVGVDASIAIRFHAMREKHPEKFNSRMKNKLWYFEFGTSETLQATCKNLHEEIDITCDKVHLDLANGTPLEGVAILNIPNIYGGSNLWGENCKRYKKRSRRLPLILPSLVMSSSIQHAFVNKKDATFMAQDIDDGLIEVIGVENAISVGQVKAGLRESGRRLAQCREVTIRTRQLFPMQIDGEPWMQPPCVLTIKLKNRTPMLMAPPSNRKSVWQFFKEKVFHKHKSLDEESHDTDLT